MILLWTFILCLLFLLVMRLGVSFGEPPLFCCCVYLMGLHQEPSDLGVPSVAGKVGKDASRSMKGHPRDKMFIKSKWLTHKIYLIPFISKPLPRNKFPQT